MTIGRFDLPQEFYTITSAKLLKQPEPQYLHAQLLWAAMGLAFQLDGEASVGFMPDRDFGQNGAPYAGGESLDFSAIPMADTLEFVNELGKTPGHTVLVNRPAFTNTTYTEASRLIPSGTTISQVPVAGPTSEQVSIVLQRFGGPYDTVNARPAPYAVERFDSTVMLHKAADVAAKHLRRDLMRTHDAFVRARMDVGTAMYPTGMTVDDDSVVAGDHPMSFALLELVAQNMDDASIPRFPSGRRGMILHPNQLRQLALDAAYQRQAAFHQQFNALYQGSYVRSVDNWDIFRSTTLTSTANTHSVPIFYGQAFAPGCVGVGQGELPRVVKHTNDNYGETAYVMWLHYLGLQTLDNRFLRSVRTS